MPDALLDDHEALLREWAALCEFFGSAFSPELHLTLCLSNQSMLETIDGVRAAKRRPAATSGPPRKAEDGEEEAVVEEIANVPRWIVPLVELAERVHLELCIPLPTPNDGWGILAHMYPRHVLTHHYGMNRMVDLDRIRQGAEENGIPPERRRDHILKYLRSELILGSVNRFCLAEARVMSRRRIARMTEKRGRDEMQDGGS